VSCKAKILVLGKLPPPYIGPSVATQLILNSKLKEKFDLIHLDTSDHRGINTLAALDFQNFYLAVKHYCLLIRAIIAHQPDLVYMPTGQTTIGYARDAGFILISKLLRPKVLGHLRGGNFKNWYDSANAATKLMVRKVHSLVDGQIVLGDNLKQLFSWLIPEEKIFVVPNGGNYPKASNKSVNESATFRALYVSNFIRTKGVLETLKAVPLVYDRHHNIEFVFAGSWSDKETKNDVQQFLREHRELPVKILGQVTGQMKFDLFLSADVFILPTSYPNEGHPWVIVEALAAGLPIISTDQGAITESVLDGVNGFVIDAIKPEQIAERVHLLIEQPELRRRLGEASRTQYFKHFTEEKMVERLCFAINSVISR
jgi:glycosyltransferase involved in cell wall biosynthesis